MPSRIAIIDESHKVINVVSSGNGPRITEIALDDADTTTWVGTQLPDLESNAANLRTKANQALQINATYLALSNPTNAQVVAQVNALTKECNGIIRLLLNKVDSTVGT